MTMINDDRKVIYALCVILLAGLIASCRGTTTPVNSQTAVPPPTLLPALPGNNCSAEDITNFLIQAENLLQQFDELATLAENTSPEDILPVIQEMDALAIKTDLFVQTPCVLKAHAALDEYFIHTVQGYMRVHTEALEITSQGNRTARDEFLAATDKLALFNKLSSELSELVASENPTD